VLTGYLLLKGRREAAVESFRRLRGPSYPEHAIQAEVEVIAAAVEEERHVAKSNIGWAALFQGSNRRRTTICCLLFVCQQYSGISFLTSYGTYFFVLCGITNSWMISFVLNVMGVAGTLCSMLLLKYFGRRPIMIVGGAMQGISMLTFAIVGVAAPGSQAAARCLAGFTLLYEFFYSASWGPLGFVLASEIASTELRAKTLGLATAVNWACTLSLAAWLPYALNPTVGNLGTKVRAL
jgi:SP family sugar:H+ symporter-like MFS transporter